MKRAQKIVVPAKWVLARWLLIGVAALVMTGCKTEDQPSAALPPVAQGAPLADAPAAESLPPAPAIPVSEVSNPQDAYAFPDRAYEMSDMFGDAPPDYVYDYGNVRPWVWVSDDGSECVVEAVPGGERYYYYEAGASEPFFVQDTSYGYGFEDGRLVAVYDRSGRELPTDDFQSRAGIAGRYMVRARALYDAARQNRHEPVAEDNWMRGRPLITGQRQAWQQQINADPNWRTYHAQNAPAVEAHWQNERVQRLKWAAHVDETMHHQDYATRERQAAQNATARSPRSSSPPAHFAGAAPRPPVMERAAIPPAPPNAALPQAHQAALPERFAQHPAPQPPALSPPGRPQMPSQEDFARQENSRQGNRPPTAGAPRQNVVQTPRHEDRPVPQQRMTPPPERTARTPRPVAQPAPPRMAMVPRHEPQAPPPQPHATPSAPPPHAAVPPSHQQAATAASRVHPAPAPGKDEQGKDDKHKDG